MRRLSKNERYLIYVMAEMTCLKARLMQIPFDIKKTHAGTPRKHWTKAHTEIIADLKAEKSRIERLYKSHCSAYKKHIEATRGGLRLGTYANAHSPHQIAKFLHCDVSIVYRVLKQFIRFGHTNFEDNRKSELRASLPVTDAHHPKSCVGAHGQYQWKQEEFRSDDFPYLEVAELKLGEISKFLGVKLHSTRFNSCAYLGDIIDFGSEKNEYDYAAKTVEWLCSTLRVPEHRKYRIKPTRIGWTLRKLAWAINNSEAKLRHRQEQLLKALPKDTFIPDDYMRNEVNDERPCSANSYRSEYYHSLDSLELKAYAKEQAYKDCDLDAWAASVESDIDKVSDYEIIKRLEASRKY